MKTYQYQELTRKRIRHLCARNPVHDPELLRTCEAVFSEVEKRGDEAVRQFTARYDGIELDNLRVSAATLQAALELVPDSVMSALQHAASNIRHFHASQKLSEEPVAVADGVTCWRAARPIASVGLYVPAGTAVLPSTVLMLGIPAKLAGCRRIVMCVPPQRDGSVAPVVLAAAQVAGIRQVFKIGGAQAVAAMSLGTETVPQVEKILGPGNRFVQTAKLLATFQGTAIDMVAGPSEVLVIADETPSPKIVAADLISQAEHGPDSQVVLVTTSERLIKEVEAELESQLRDLPRADFARQSMAQSFAILVSNLEEAFEFSNRYAPEHLILSVSEARQWLGKVSSAGSVFVGEWTPEVAGDYASGTNHTLPTSGLARCVSGVSMDSFVKKVTFQELTREGLRGLAETLQTLAEVESLEGHARAVRYRLQADEKEEE